MKKKILATLTTLLLTGTISYAGTPNLSTAGMMGPGMGPGMYSNGMMGPGERGAGMYGNHMRPDTGTGGYGMYGNPMMAGPGMRGYGMHGPDMMGGYGQHGHMMPGHAGMSGYALLGCDNAWSFPGVDNPEYFEKYNTFLDSTRDLRKQIHDLHFDYMESLRNPDETQGNLRKKQREILMLKKELWEKKQGLFGKPENK